MLVMGGLRRLLARCFDAVERPIDRLVGPSLNPFAHLGALGFFHFWIVAVSGIYLFIFFDTGIERAYESVEYLTLAHWYHAGVMRSLHRYASDLMVVFALTHLLREFARDRYRGTRWFSWFTGMPVLWLLFISGITGYWLVWDALAQYVAIISSELLDRLGIFGEPIARNFVSTGTLTSRFFTLLVFLHVAVPLFLLFLMWVHILRISRPKVNPPRALAGTSLGALLVVSLFRPALSQGPANLARLPADIGLDWFYLPLYPLADAVSHDAVWGILVVATVVIGAMPWLPPLRRAPAAVVDLAHCNGCARCAEDCPYEAIRLVPRTDGLPFPTEAKVNPSLCVSCGICVGSCPSSTPFRRTEELHTGIDLPELSLRSLRERAHAISAGLEGPTRIMVLGCERGAAGARKSTDTLMVPCVGMIPPPLIDYILSRDLADAVLLAGCAESDCYHRLGIDWTRQRIARERDPYLRSRVPRDRLRTLWASRFERGRLEAALDAARREIPPLGQKGGAP
ncbi:MAG: cytochrome b N-terminal domain-containing protein [Alphaproteobacteria bacterium]|nr:cytochrome b N-terminal domain-containing protein [Alphaproteobacteria bacterium]